MCTSCQIDNVTLWTGFCPKCYYKNWKLRNKDKVKGYRVKHAENIKLSKIRYNTANKDSIRLKRKQYYLRHKEQISKQRKEYYSNTKEYHNKMARRYYEQNKDKLQAMNRQYYHNTKHTEKHKINYRSRVALRNARRLQATPKWADLAAIKEIYKSCPKGYHVDHIVPLKGKNVSGLHVSWNLQHLTAIENQRKNNKV